MKVLYGEDAGPSDEELEARAMRRGAARRGRRSGSRFGLVGATEGTSERSGMRDRTACRRRRTNPSRTLPGGRRKGGHLYWGGRGRAGAGQGQAGSGGVMQREASWPPRTLPAGARVTRETRARTLPPGGTPQGRREVGRREGRPRVTRAVRPRRVGPSLGCRRRADDGSPARRLRRIGDSRSRQRAWHALHPELEQLRVPLAERKLPHADEQHAPPSGCSSRFCGVVLRAARSTAPLLRRGGRRRIGGRLAPPARCVGRCRIGSWPGGVVRLALASEQQAVALQGVAVAVQLLELEALARRELRLLRERPPRNAAAARPFTALSSHLDSTHAPEPSLLACRISFE